ncbi:ABC transporter substrate-binding protein, partial [Chloroflexota bacterium]
TGALIFHIRKGIRWALNPASEAGRLVGGRELTTDDVVFTLEQVTSYPGAYLARQSPELKAAKITSPEPWTVKIEVPWDILPTALDRLGEFTCIVPPEVWDKYGDLKDWKNSVGTGPFMLTDVVAGSTLTMMRNPDYWDTDPIGPGKGNQLPYLDSVKYLVIPDASTAYAALRTGKLDWLGKGSAGYGIEVSREDAVEIKKTAPQLLSSKVALSDSSGTVALKIDREPFNDIKVRRALTMATDFEAIKMDYFDGEAQIVVFPIPYMKGYEDAYYGPDEQGQWPSDCPESLKELYTYNPEKAKALLAEAGHPQIKTSIVVMGTMLEEIDYFSIVAAMWEKVGVDLEILVKEAGSYNTIRNNKSFEGMASTYRPKIAQRYMMVNIYGDGVNNQCDIDDPVVNEAYPKIQAAAITDIDEANRLHKELMKYVLGQAWAIPKVSPYNYTLWWPWLKNYSGEVKAGHDGYFFQWIWIDQELKKSMGY